MRFTVEQREFEDGQAAAAAGRPRRASLTVNSHVVGVHLMQQHPHLLPQSQQRRRMSAGPTLYAPTAGAEKCQSPPLSVIPRKDDAPPPSQVPPKAAADARQLGRVYPIGPTWVLNASTLQLVDDLSMDKSSSDQQYATLTTSSSDAGAASAAAAAATSAAASDENTANEKSQLLVADLLAERGQQFAARQTRRLVEKDGTCKISRRNVTERKRKYLVDIFTTLVDMRWRYNVLMFTAAFVVSWLLFSVVWFVIAVVHKDTEHGNDEDWAPCVSNVYDFPTALLFSIETQSTIGYGYRVITPYCVVPFFVLVIQTCFGVMMQSLLAGLVFSKMSRPKQRAHTIMFSRTAVVCKRDYEYCLLFRVGDMRKSHFIGTSIRAMVVQDRLTKEGEVIPLCQNPLDLETETCTSDNFVFLVWPVTVVHKINSSSPLWDFSSDQMLSRHFEIIVILEGVVESTGGTTQLRTSYLPSEIQWGHRLAPLLTYQKENGQYKIDYAQFHAVEPISMPDCSAKTLAERRRDADCDKTTDDDDGGDYLPAYFTISCPTSSKAPSANGGRSSNSSIVRRMRNSVSPRRRSTKTRRLTGTVGVDSVSAAVKPQTGFVEESLCGGNEVKIAETDGRVFDRCLSV